MSAQGYTAKDLGDIADFFATLASYQRGTIRMQRTKAHKNECELRAKVYDDCADILRKTTFEHKPIGNDMLYKLLVAGEATLEDQGNAAAWLKRLVEGKQ